MTKDQISSFLWKRFPRLAAKLHSVTNNTVLNNAEFMEVYRETIDEGKAVLSLRDMFNLYLYVSRARSLDGDMAEVGVFQGGGAKIICRFKGEAVLHLFDTFEGMPATDQARDYHRKGDFSQTSLELVQSRLKAFANIVYHKGYFPETALASDVASKTFSFVHLDMDIFQSTLDGLEFFYPRLVEGGFLLSHDYATASCPGVKAAFDIFCEKTGVLPIPLWDTHCLIVKQAKG